MILNLIKKFIDFFSAFDAYGGKVELRHKGTPVIGNFFGALITFITFGLSFYLSWETFYNFVTMSNPTVATSYEYDLNSSEINSANFFFSVSFYDKRSDTKSRQLNVDTLNSTSIYMLHPISINCTDCISNDTELNLCNSEMYSDMTLDSISKEKSKNILEIFSNYSYCLPDNFSANLADNQNSDYDQDSTFQIFIPFSNTPIDFANTPQNTKNVIQTSDITKIINTNTQTPVVQNTQNQQNPNESNLQPNQIGPNQMQPSQTQPNNQQPIGSQTQPNNQQPIGSQTQPNNQQQPTTSGSNPTSPGSNPGGTANPGTAPTAPTSSPNQTSPTGPTTNTSPTSSPTQTSPTGPNTNTSPTSSPTQTSPTSSTTQTSPTSSPTQTSPTSSPTQTTSPTSPTNPPKRITKNASSNILRNLQTTTSTNTTDITQVGGLQKVAYDYIKTQMQKQKFPKILFINKNVKINPSNPPDKIISSSYILNILDYKVPVLDTPIVYDVAVQQVTISIVTPGFIVSSEQDITYLEIMSITQNTLDSLDNTGAYFSFKLLNEAKDVTITYVAFTDFLGTMGSYLAVFDLLASFLTFLWNDNFTRKKLANGIFELIDNEPDPVYKHDLKAKKHMDFIKNHIENLENDIRVNQVKIADKKEDSEIKNIKEEAFTKLSNTTRTIIEKSVVDPSTLQIEENKEVKADDNNELNIESPIKNLNKAPVNEVLTNQKLFDEIQMRIEREEKNIDFNNLKNNNKNDKGSDGSELKNREDFEMKEIIKISEFDNYVRKIDRINKNKNSIKKRVKVRLVYIYFIDYCGCIFRDKSFYKKFKLIEKCNEIIDEMLEISYHIRIFSQFNMLKSYIFNPKEKAVFNQLSQSINLRNYSKSKEYLNMIYDNNQKFKFKKYEKLQSEDKCAQEKLLSSYLDKFNF